MYSLYAHPNSYSSCTIQIFLRELGVAYTLHNVDLIKGEQFKIEFLEISREGTVPVLVVDQSNQKHIGTVNIRNFLVQTHSEHPVCKGDPDSEGYLRKLDEAPVGFLTFGLAFNQEYTKILRYPYHEPDFFEQSRQYILERGVRLQETIATCTEPHITEALIQTAESHYTNADQYLEPDKYSSALSAVSSLLDYFESLMGSSNKVGLWLGGIQMNIADVFLGMLLHRLWQLGMEKALFQDGVRPHLTLYYDRIRDRPSFKTVTKWDTETSVNVIKSSEDMFADNAKWSLGIMAALGGLYLGKKIFKK